MRPVGPLTSSRPLRCLTSVASMVSVRRLRPVRSARTAVVAVVVATAAAVVPWLTGSTGGAHPAGAEAGPQAGETVNVWLTTTSDPTGRHVVEGLQRQTPITFAPGGGGLAPGAGGDITVDESTRYQQFAGAGAAFTDTAAWLLNSSGALSGATREEVMRKLFSPTDGIGISFLRNPMGASDLARSRYTYDDLPAGRTDPGLDHFSIDHDLADVLPLTEQAQELNPDLKVMASPWTAPAWMKDNDSLDQGWLQARYYGTYAQYFVKYLQAYAAQGVHVDYVTEQNEPTCCGGYPSMRWTGGGLAYFAKHDLLPQLQAAGLDTKMLVLDWNWDKYDEYAAPLVDDPAIRNSPNFGGIAWHGYAGNVGEQTAVHRAHPSVDAFDTEHSGGAWVSDQQQEDMLNLIDYTRNWGRSWNKWSLAVDQNGGPHDGGCGTCTGLITVPVGNRQQGAVSYTIEYYTMGHLTKFVRPGAYRIASTASATVPNVAWRNPDGSKALIAYNDTGSDQRIRVGWGGRSFSYDLPARASATFTWSGDPS
jgi:glucosylceramidase